MKALLWVSIGLAAALGACSGSLSGNMTGTGGAGALTGSGTGTGGKVTSGAGGKVGSGSGGTVGYNPSACAALSAEYDAAMTAARSCTPGSTTQCTEPVNSSLSACGSCVAFVTDPSKLLALEQMWQAANCNQRIPCPTSGACPMGVPDVCVADPSGQGLCSYGDGSGPHIGGTGGTTGTGGSTGAGGSPVDGGELDVCGAYAIKYATVLDAVKSCTFGATGQCAQSVAPALDSCTAGCTVYVNDASELNLIRQLWTQAGCNKRAVSCPLILCIPADGSACSQTDGGGGTCVSTTTRLL
jgi:hypothetical protein